MPLPLQQIIEGKYEILEKIAEGGIGAIYKVRHRLLDEIRVVKVLRPQHASREDLQRRFRHEAKTAIRLKHPNIAHLYDFSIAEDGTAYIVMEFIDGVALDRMLVACGPPPIPVTAELAHQSLQAMAYLHRQGFVHRDISPDNLMLTHDLDGHPLIKLIDLGIAKNLDSEVHLTATGTFLGKVRYCSPEHFSADSAADLDQRSDNYSFGVMLYEMLTGRLPVSGQNFAELAGGHLFRPPLPFEESDPDERVPKGLRQVVLKALAKEPDNRIASAEEFAELLQPFRKDLKGILPIFQGLIDHTRKEAQRTERDEPATTQGKLDEHFALEKTTASRSTTGLTIEESQESRRTRELARAARKIQRFLAVGELEKATTHLAEAEEVHGPAPLFVDLRRDLEHARLREQEIRIRALLDNARRWTSNSQYQKAIEAVRAVLELQPDSKEARRLLERNQRALEKLLAASVGEARSAIAAGALDQAARRLEAVRHLDPDSKELRALEQELRGSRQQRQEADRRAAAGEKAAVDVEKLLEAGELEKAADAIYAARQVFGDDPRFETLDQQRRKIAERRLQKLRDTVERAREKLAAGSARKAYLMLGDVLSTDPENQPARELMPEVEAALQALEAEKREAAVDQVTGIVAQLVVQGKLAEARDRLEVALAEFGEHPKLVQIRATTGKLRAGGAEPE